MSKRVKRVCELIHRELGAIVQKDIDFKGTFVSIRGIDITPDLKQCHVFVGVIGSSRDEANVLAILEKKRSMLQSRLSKRVVLRYTPILHFKIDHSIERGVQTLNALQEVDDLPTASADDEKSDDDAKKPQS